ncbi:DUF6175 family protein [Phaeodactylibacter xiamenensis]|uniref:DUF6175 family protein n=1 Tax=Phaeodactylibacter xiamenensis TaxID=1524460 RepID=UPI003CCBB93B
MSKYLLLLLPVLLMSVSPLKAQSDGEVVQAQPRIMVVPFAKEGEDIREVLESDIIRRVALTKVKEAFDREGFTTVDFLGKLKASQVDQVMTTDARTDLKKQIIEQSGADIYVDVEVEPVRTSGGNSVRLILTAYDAFTGSSLANKTSASPMFYTEDYGKLVEKAMSSENKDAVDSGAGKETVLEAFLAVMQSKFNGIVVNGRPVRLEFNLSPNAMYDMDSPVGDDYLPLSVLIEEWAGQAAYKNNYSVSGITSTAVIIDQLFIPLRDENDRNYTPSLFSIEVLKYFNRLKLSDDPDTRIRVKRVIRGGSIIITFQ